METDDDIILLPETELYSKLFVYSDQPTRCPNCGAASDIILNLQHTKDIIQVHKCINDVCEFEFVMTDDNEFENGALL